MDLERDLNIYISYKNVLLEDMLCLNQKNLAIYLDDLARFTGITKWIFKKRSKLQLIKIHIQPLRVFKNLTNFCV